MAGIMTPVSFLSWTRSDPSQNDPDSKDFWFNMQALTLHLQREAELNPQASYYNVGVLKYQVSRKAQRVKHFSVYSSPVRELASPFPATHTFKTGMLIVSNVLLP